MTMLRTLQVLALAATLLVGAVWGQGQPAPAAAARERILGTAQRKGEPESVVAPILARLDRLASQGLPTDRFASIMVEGLSKGASPQALADRAASLEAALYDAQRSVQRAEAQGARDDFTGRGRNAVEDLSESIEAGLKSGDLERVQASLRTDSLSRLLAGADALAHLQAVRFPAPAAERLLRAVSAPTSDSEIRLLTLAVLSGRKQGLADDAIAATLSREMRGGMAPSAVAGAWGMRPGEAAGMQRMGQGQGQTQGMGPGGMGGGKH